MTRNEAAQAIRSIGENLIAVADYFAATDAPEDTPDTKEPEKTIRLEDVRTVLSEISRSGHTAEMKALLAKHGAKKLSDIKPEDYAALLAEAEEVKNAS